MTNKTLQIYSILIALLAVVSSCEKDSKDTDYGINEYQKNMINIQKIKV